MIGIEQAADALGLTTRQVYRRLSAVRPVLSGHLRRGENNRLLLDGSAVEILRAVEDYRKAGVTVDQAIERIRDSVGGKPGGNGGEPEGNAPGVPEPWAHIIAAKDETIRTKDETIRMLQEEAAHLREEVARLLPLALPAPRRGFFARLRLRRATEAS